MLFRKKKGPNPAPWSKDPRVHLDIDEVSASRAIFIGATETPRVRITMTTTDGQIVDFELDTDKTRELIEQATMSYYAIIPPLRTSRNSWGG